MSPSLSPFPIVFHSRAHTEPPTFVFLLAVFCGPRRRLLSRGGGSSGGSLWSTPYRYESVPFMTPSDFSWYLLLSLSLMSSRGCPALAACCHIITLRVFPVLAPPQPLDDFDQVLAVHLVCGPFAWQNSICNLQYFPPLDGEWNLQPARYGGCSEPQTAATRDLTWRDDLEGAVQHQHLQSTLTCASLPFFYPSRQFALQSYVNKR
jgi:hypothetical protein